MRMSHSSAVLSVCLLLVLVPCSSAVLYPVATPRNDGTDSPFQRTETGSFCQTPNQAYDDKVVAQCGKYLKQLLQSQFPWIPSDTSFSGKGNRTMDPLDSLEHICKVYRRTLTCIRLLLGDIEVGCLQYGFAGNYFDVHTTMRFLCSNTDRLALL